MKLPETTPAQLAELKSLRPGTPITVLINGEPKAAKFAIIPANSTGRFQCRIKGQIAWLEGHQFAGVDTAAAPLATPAGVISQEAPKPGFVKLENKWAADMPNELRGRMDNCEQSYSDFERNVFSATKLAKEIVEDFADSSHKLNEELNGSDKEAAKDAKSTLLNIKTWLSLYAKEKPAEVILTTVTHDESGAVAKVKQEVIETVAPKKKGEYVSRDTQSGHKWEKQNLITEVKKGRSFDRYKCTVCGLEANNYGIGSEKMEVTKAVGKKECLPLPVLTPLEQGITHVKLLAIGSNHPSFQGLEIGSVYPVVDAPAEYIKYKADVWIPGKGEACRLFPEEWAKASAPLHQLAPEETPDFVKEHGGTMAVSEDGSSFQISVPIEFAEAPQQSGGKVIALNIAQPEAPKIKLADFSKSVLFAVAEMERAGGNVFAKELAERMQESAKKVAGSFSPLAKVGLLQQAGEHGARYVQLTAAGWEYVGEDAPQAPAADDVEVGEELAQADFKITDDMLIALSKISTAKTVVVADIYTANKLNTIYENRPELLTKTPSKNEDAYFDAGLTEAGRELMYKLAPEWMELATAQAQEVPQQPAADDKPAKGKRGPKKGQKAGEAGERNVVAAVKKVRPAKAAKPAGERSKGGRPAAGNKSLRELVFDEVKNLVENGQFSAKELVTSVDGVLGCGRMPVQNAIFKLGRSGFLATDKETGKVLSPVQLAGTGLAGYSVNPKGAVKKRAQELLAQGKSDIEVARLLNADDTYIRAIRLGKTKEVTEAVTE